MTAHIVIGSNYGDEGKGHVVDWLSHKLLNPIVIRCNGGSQAAHTVEDINGKRHIFRTIGSGALNYAPTYLSEHFIFNCDSAFGELKELLNEFSIIPTVFVNKNALLTTPIDVLINVIVERYRGNNRHGSCGYGIGETVERCEKFIPTTFDDLKDVDSLIEKVKHIEKIWFPKRLAQLGITDMQCSLTPQHYDHFRRICSMVTLVTKSITNEFSLLSNYSDLIFEGAQGLLLDQAHNNFPHVTRSNTGINNACSILDKCGIEEANVYYVTRGYLTRHGAGPLQNEFAGNTPKAYNDITNTDNEFQGSLRYAPLDCQSLLHEITNDLQNNHNVLIKNINQVVTCVDQCTQATPFEYFSADGFKNAGYNMTAQQIAHSVSTYYPFNNVFYSDGPRTDQIHLLSKP